MTSSSTKCLVAFVTRDIEMNAIFYGNRRLARKFIENGQEVDFVGLEGADQEAVSTITEGAAALTLGARRVRQQILDLSRYFRTRQPDVIFASGFNESLACVLASWLAKRRPTIVARVHIVASVYLRDQKSFFDRHLSKRLMAWAFRPPVKVVAVSADAARDFEQLLSFVRGSVAVVYDPVLDDLPRPARRWTHPWLENKALRLVLAAGVLVPRKGFTTLIRAFAKLAPDNPNLRLLIAGEGPQRNELEALIDDLGLRQSIELPGFIPNPDLPYYRADLFALSSVYEGLGNVIVEALAAGCPVVSTDCPVGPAEILEGGRLGELVPIGDADAMAAAIYRALQAPVPAKALKTRARDFHVDIVWPAMATLAGIETSPSRWAQPSRSSS